MISGRKMNVETTKLLLDIDGVDSEPKDTDGQIPLS
jgi:hypothetical protein